MRAVSFSAAVVAALVVIGPAFGASDRDWDDCKHDDPDRSIGGCTRVLEDTKLSRRNRAVAYYNRGNSYMRKDDNRRALQDYARAIELDPKYAKAYNNRGEAYENLNELDPALAAYSMAIKLDPKYARAYFNRGDIFRKKKDLDRAIGDYSAAIRIDPKYVAAYNNRGYTYFRKGDFKAAAADHLRSLELRDAVRPMLFRYLARARAGENAGAELEANADRLKSKEWPYAAVELYLGRRAPEATLDAATTANQRCEAQFFIGEWHLVRGDSAQARSALQAAADTCPKSFVEYDAAVAELARIKP